MQKDIKNNLINSIIKMKCIDGYSINPGPIKINYQKSLKSQSFIKLPIQRRTNYEDTLLDISMESYILVKRNLMYKGLIGKEFNSLSRNSVVNADKFHQELMQRIGRLRR